METIRIAAGEKRDVEVGGLLFAACRREVGKDGGISLNVFGRTQQEWTEVVRFDLFRDDPHYHVPATNLKQINLEPEHAGDPLGFALVCIQERMPEMIREAGYPEIADRVDREALNHNAQLVFDMVATAPEPGPGVEHELTPHMREALGLED